MIPLLQRAQQGPVCSPLTLTYPYIFTPHQLPNNGGFDSGRNNSRSVSPFVYGIENDYGAESSSHRQPLLIPAVALHRAYVICLDQHELEIVDREATRFKPKGSTAKHNPRIQAMPIIRAYEAGNLYAEVYP